LGSVTAACKVSPSITIDIAPAEAAPGSILTLSIFGLSYP
jgi:hypothetical protein